MIFVYYVLQLARRMQNDQEAVKQRIDGLNGETLSIEVLQ
jgi:hypothetical protein